MNKELEDLKGAHYFDEIVNIIERLRAPDGCPWDREQTLDTLRSSITEEAYELSDAISRRFVIAGSVHCVAGECAE